MVHIMFDKKTGLGDLSNKFTLFQKESFLIKTSTIFVETNSLTALLSNIVFSDNYQKFLIEISTRESKTIIKLYFNAYPKKTCSVITFIKLLAIQTMFFYYLSEMKKINLHNYLQVVVLY